MKAILVLLLSGICACATAQTNKPIAKPPTAPVEVLTKLPVITDNIAKLDATALANKRGLEHDAKKKKPAA